jgi:hypothetical protein
MGKDVSGFAVNDKRHFTPEGESRSAEAPQAASAATETADRAPAGPPKVEFGEFLLSLAAQASLMLRDPDAAREADGLPPADAEGARHLISIIEMLADKTEGRRTAEESTLLERVLFELRMAYVERQQGDAR